MAPRPSQAKHWIFTLNNYSQEDFDTLCNTAENYEYLVFGKEVGQQGTAHLQGYVVLKQKLRLANVKALAPFGNAHLEVRRGSIKQASDYCKKDGDFEEFGELPSQQGKRSEFNEFKEWIKTHEERPKDRECAEEWPQLWGRYRTACINFLDLFQPHTRLVTGDLRGWQQEVEDLTQTAPDDRKVYFYVDENGNSGKSWLTRWWYSEDPHRVQIFRIAKRDDLAHHVDPTKTLFVFDVPRGGMEYLQYNILEQLKDRQVFSPKYDSRMKVIRKPCHVLVFCNEQPDRNKMSRDRYVVTNIRQL